MYIDPGSGSLIIQALIAAIVVIPVFFRRQISRAVTAVRHPGKPPGRDQGPNPGDGGA